MTVCIAAKTADAGASLVMCTDMKGSVEWSSAETTYKWIPLGGGFYSLIAGLTSVAKEFSWHCGQAIRTESPDNIRDVISALRKGVGAYKLAFADSQTLTTLGIGYAEFRKTGRRHFPEETYREVAAEIKAHRSGVELIVCGFLPSNKRLQEDLKSGKGIHHLPPRLPYIFKVAGDSVTTCDDFAAIGSGAYLAEAALLQRSQNPHHSTPTTVYHLYEAKRLSERAEGVGVRTRLIIASYNDSVVQINDLGLEALNSDFQRLSAQVVQERQIGPEWLTNVSISAWPGQEF